MHPTPPSEAAAFSGYLDLASSRFGGAALLANDEFFAEKENLLKSERAIFVADRFTDRGKWMDGWETRRRRTPGHDWCIVRLGFPGSIHGLDIDTAHFLGNHPAYASVDVCDAPADESAEALGANGAAWRELLPRSPLRPGSQNLFAAADHERATHVRLNIFPDGGVARLRVYGRVIPDPARLRAGQPSDLAAAENGGLVVAASDMFFGSKENLIMPGRSTHMGDGWETRRRRGPGNDWAVVALGAQGRVRKLVVDTSHFKGNYPDACTVEACNVPDEDVDALNAGGLPWTELLPIAKLRADTEHVFERELKDLGAVSHVRLNIFPDGGVARLRVFGEPAAR
jgi:allantoicase